MRWWFAVLLLTPAAACGDAGPQKGFQFLAVQGSFANYTSWQRFDLGPDQSDQVHADGNRVVYLNKTPPHGSTAYPQGTLIVKTIGADTPSPDKTFAMAKRGAGYNADGAAGWEWFELQGTASAPLIVWRGTEPPANEAYAAPTTPSVCNDCHRGTQDSVFGAGLQPNDF